MIWIIIILIIFILVASYIIFNLNRKTTTYEKWITEFSDTVKVIDEELNIIDEEGTFRSDDEIGYFYQAMYSILKRLSEIGIIDEKELIIREEPVKKEFNPFYDKTHEIQKRIDNRRKNITLDSIQNKKFQPKK